MMVAKLLIARSCETWIFAVSVAHLTQIPLFVQYGIVFLGGLVMLLAPYTKRWRTRPDWVRIALWMFGVSTVSWGLLGCLLAFGPTQLSTNSRGLLQAVKTILSGAALGLLLLLLLARGFATLRSEEEKQKER